MINTISKTLGAQEKTQDIKQSPSMKIGVTPGFKDKAECTPYVSPGNQISHIATNEGVVSIQNT